MLKTIITGLLLSLPITISAQHKPAPAPEVKRMRASSAEAAHPERSRRIAGAAATRVEAKLTAEQAYQSQQLFLAIAEDNKEAGLAALKKLIADKANLNQPNGNGDTPLCFAIDIENTDAVSELITAGADVNQAAGLMPSERTMPLMRAVDKGLVDIVKLLLQNGAQVNAQDAFKNTALTRAIQKENVAVVAALLEANPNPFLKNGKGQTPLELAQAQLQTKGKESASAATVSVAMPCMAGKSLPVEASSLAVEYTGVDVDDINQIVQLLKKQRAEWDERGRELPEAIDCNDMKKFKELLTLGANVNIGNPQEHILNKLYPLHRAVKHQNLEAIKLLLEAGVDIDLKEYDGHSALVIASGGGYISTNTFEIVRALLSANADVNTCDDSHLRRPLLSNIITAQYFKRLPETPGRYIDTLEHDYAGKQEMLNLLLSYKPDVNLSDAKGDTPLMLAALVDDYFAAKALLEHGADITVKDKKGKTAYDWAVGYEYIEVAQLIKSYEEKRAASAIVMDIPEDDLDDESIFSRCTIS